MQTPRLVEKVCGISAACAFVEVAPEGFPDDNLSVPLTAAGLAYAVFRS